MFISDGRRRDGYKDSIIYLEPQLSKTVFNPDVPALQVGYYDYRIHEYPPMAQEYFGRINRTVYDIDFNNFFLRAYLEYLTVNNIKHQRTVKTLKDILRKLNNERDKLKRTYYLIYHPKQYVNTVSPEVCRFTGYGEQLSQRKIQSVIESITGKQHITYDCIEELIDRLSRINGYYVIINRYHFLKYKYLAGIGWLKRKNEQLWWNIMKHATQKMFQVIRFCKENGYKVYSVYIDSIQTNVNLLKKHPELFEFYNAKLDKTGRDYGLCLPPSYWINKHVAQWLKIDYRYWFRNGAEEEITTFNTQLIYLKKFIDRVNHPLKDCIEIDLEKQLIITHKLPKLEPHIFCWDFTPEKTECLKADLADKQLNGDKKCQ